MSETTTGEASNITPGEETGQDYVCRFALRGQKGLFFVWDEKIPGLELLEDGAEVKITHDGSKYPKVEKIEKMKGLSDAGESKVEQTVRKAEKQSDESWRIARAVATERVFGNGAGVQSMTAEEMKDCLETADEIATYIATGQKPIKKD